MKHIRLKNEYIKCNMQTVFSVWISECQEACVLERFYRIDIIPFSRILRNVCFGDREDYCYTAILVLLQRTSFPWQQNLKCNPIRFNTRFLPDLPCRKAFADHFQLWSSAEAKLWVGIDQICDSRYSWILSSVCRDLQLHAKKGWAEETCGATPACTISDY